MVKQVHVELPDSPESSKSATTESFLLSSQATNLNNKNRMSEDVNIHSKFHESDNKISAQVFISHVTSICCITIQLFIQVPCVLPEVVVLNIEDTVPETPIGVIEEKIVVADASKPGTKQERLRMRDIKRTNKSWQSVQLGSPPLKKYGQEFGYKIGQDKCGDKKQMMKFEQPQSLDSEGMAPMIKITPMSDLESDSDSSMLHHLPVMDYLSPFCLQVLCKASIISFTRNSISGARLPPSDHSVHLQFRI